MKKKYTRFQLLIVLLVLLLISLTGYAVGKYITIQNTPGQVSFTAKLAETIEVWVHPHEDADKNGEYELRTDLNPVLFNGNYTLIPGLDIDADPYIAITGKTPIPAYLYVTVTTDQEALSWIMDDCWQATGTEGEYIYCTVNADNTKTPVALVSTPPNINIFKDQTLYVSDSLLSHTGDHITIRAYLTEARD